MSLFDMNIDDKLDQKINKIDEKMAKGIGIDLLKLQSCAQQMMHMGPIGHPHKLESGDETLDRAHLLLNKLMTLQMMNIFEESITTE